MASASATSLLELIDWDGLPADVRDTIRELGPMLVDGYSRQEIARITHQGVVAVAKQVDLIRTAIIAQAVDRVDELDTAVRELVMASLEVHV